MYVSCCANYTYVRTRIRVECITYVFIARASALLWLILRMAYCRYGILFVCDIICVGLSPHTLQDTSCKIPAFLSGHLIMAKLKLYNKHFKNTPIVNTAIKIMSVNLYHKAILMILHNVKCPNLII